MLTKGSDNQQNKLLSSISLILCGLLLFGMLFSSLFVSTEFHHDCSGEDCPICQMIAICESFIDQVGGGLIVLAAVFFTLLCLYNAVSITVSAFNPLTLVSQKVRLNNSTFLKSKN